MPRAAGRGFSGGRGSVALSHQVARGNAPPDLPVSRRMDVIECRAGCGACCTAPSITSPIPGMPQGKPAGVRCIQLTADFRCALFGSELRPAVCASFMPAAAMCGASAREAWEYLSRLERVTSPAAAPPHARRVV